MAELTSPLALINVSAFAQAVLAGTAPGQARANSLLSTDLGGSTLFLLNGAMALSSTGMITDLLGFVPDSVLEGSGLKVGLIGFSGSERLVVEPVPDPSPDAPLPTSFVLAGDGNDLVLGGRGTDGVLGEGGDDVLLGGAGDDDLDGGAGRDLLVGGLGIDTLTGGTEADVFVLEPTWLVPTSAEGGEALPPDSGVENPAITAPAVPDPAVIEPVTADPTMAAPGAGQLGVAALSAEPTVPDPVMPGAEDLDLDPGISDPDSIDPLVTAPEGVIPAVDIITDFEVGIDQLDLTAIFRLDPAFRGVANPWESILVTPQSEGVLVSVQVPAPEVDPWADAPAEGMGDLAVDDGLTPDLPLTHDLVFLTGVDGDALLASAFVVL